MYNKNYDKKLIILKQDTGGYAAGKGILTGTVTVEIRNGKGKLSINTKGLKTISDNRYKAFAVSSNSVAEIGAIELNRNNESSLKIDFNPDNFLGSTNTIDEFKVFVISTEQSKEITPLVGFYNDEKQSFKHTLLKANIVKSQPTAKKTEQAPIKQEVQKPIRVETQESAKNEIETSFKKEMQAPNVVYNGETDNTLIPNRVSEQKEHKNSSPCDEEDGIKPYPIFDIDNGNELTAKANDFATARDFFHDYNKAFEDKASDSFPNFSEPTSPTPIPNERLPKNSNIDIKDASSFGNTIRESVKKLDDLQKIPCLTPEEMKKYDIRVEALAVKVNSGITEMYKYNPRLDPFPSLKGIEWIRISDAELVFLPIPLFKYMNHPFLAASYEEYKHFMLGKCVETSKLYLGVPYLYRASDKEMANSLKFNRFKCINDKMLAEESYGYWIMDMN